VQYSNALARTSIQELFERFTRIASYKCQIIEMFPCELIMGLCKKCGKPVKERYLYCSECNLTANTYKDENGYERFKDSDILVHRWVAEKKLGRPLEPWEVVHHKDRNKLNNSPDNLWVFNGQEEHDEAHWEDAERHGVKASFQGFNKKRKIMSN